MTSVKRTNMMNIQVIDGASNCTYDIFQIDSEDFKVLFPGEGQDIEFSEDLDDRGDKVDEVCERLWNSRIDKKQVNGIHGTLFYGLEEKRKYYPTKKESD